MEGPLVRWIEIVPPEVRRVVERETPIPAVAGRAAALASEHPELVRADIGQIAGYRPEDEVPYGAVVGLEPVREAVAETWNRTFDLDPPLAPANVAVCTGAAEGLALCLRCFARDRVVGLPRGCWENYHNGVDLAGGEAVFIDYFAEDGSLDGDHLVRQLRDRGVDLILANFPSNPTGAVLDRAEMQTLAEIARSEDLLVISDEVYDRLRYDGQPPVTLLEFAPERAIAISSASKEYLLPGARVGYVICFETDFVDRGLRKLIRAGTASPNVLGQRRLLELLRSDLEDLRAGREASFIAGVRDELRGRRDRLVAVLREFGFTIEGRAGREPEGTIFLMAGMPEWWRGSAEKFARDALEAGCVSTVPGASFGLPDAVRFSYGGLTPGAIRRLRENLVRFREETVAS